VHTARVGAAFVRETIHMDEDADAGVAPQAEDATLEAARLAYLALVVEDERREDEERRKRDWMY